MDQADQKHYEDLLDTFTTEGWKSFIQNVKDQFENGKEHLFRVAEPNGFFYQKGRLETLEGILKFEEFVRASLENFDADL